MPYKEPTETGGELECVTWSPSLPIPFGYVVQYEHTDPHAASDQRGHRIVSIGEASIHISIEQKHAHICTQRMASACEHKYT